MTSRLDELLAEPEPVDRASLDHLRTVLHAELMLKRPVRRWRTQVAWLAASTLGLALVVGAVMLATGQASAAALSVHGPVMAALALVSVFGAWAALSPRGGALRPFAVAAAGAGAVAMLALRGAGAPSTSPEWLCTVSHLGVAVLPLGVALFFLRDASPGRWRSAAAGVAVGTAGAMLGEIGCGRGWQHVLAYHLTAWALVALAAVAGRRFLKTRSFAP